MSATWSLVPLPLQNLAGSSASSQFTYCWSLAWEFWALLCWCVRWVQLCISLNILWHCLSLELEWKLTFSSSVATAEFCRFAGILSAAVAQHHLLRFVIAGIPSLPLAVFVVMFPKTHLTLHSRMSYSRWVITPPWLSESFRSFLYSFSVYSCHFFLISSASVQYHFCPLLCPSLHESFPWDL